MLHIVTALPCEAKPLIRHFGLNGRPSENGFRIYENHRMRLIIAGVGKSAAAAACGYLQGLEPGSKHAWLNLGIAGHASLKIGHAILANKVTDAATGKHWYPAMPFTPPCPTGPLTCVDQAETSYHGDAAYDMETAGFYATALRFNSSELVQVFKVISDNQSDPAGQVSATLAEQIIDAQLDTLDNLVDQLFELDKLLAQQRSMPDIEQFQQRWHFTVSQQHQLRRLLQRWQARSDSALDIKQLEHAKNSKAVIALINTMIADLPLSFK